MRFKEFLDVLGKETILKVSLYTGIFVTLSFEPRILDKCLDMHYLFERRVLSIELVDNILYVMLDCRSV